MGIQRNTNGSGAMFLRINAKEGCFQRAQLDDKGKPVKGEDGKNVQIKEPVATRLEGTVTSIEFKQDPYEGQMNYRVQLGIQDTEPGQPKMYVEFPFGNEANGAGFFGLALMGKLNSADLTKPISLMPWLIPAGNEYQGQVSQSDRTGVTVYQYGQKLKEDFGNGATELPKRRQVEVRGKLVNDPTDTSWDDVAQALLNTLKAKLTPGAGEAHAPADEGVDLGEAQAAVAGQQHARERQAA